jgi:hypothetical protein
MVAPAATLFDDFNDNVPDIVKWPNKYGEAEVGGRASIACANNYPRYASAEYDLTGSYALVEVVQLANVGNGSAQTLLQLADATSGDLLEMYVFDNPRTLTMHQAPGGNPIGGTIITYSATAHRWWRIRESNGSLFFDTSPEGIVWTNRLTETNSTPVNNLRLQLVCGFFGTEPTPGTALFDNFNNPPLGPTAPLVSPNAAVVRASTW